MKRQIAADDARALNDALTAAQCTRRAREQHFALSLQFMSATSGDRCGLCGLPVKTTLGDGQSCAKCGTTANLVPIYLCEAKRGGHALCHECAIFPFYRAALANAPTTEAAIDSICSALALLPPDEDTLLLYHAAYSWRAGTPYPRDSTHGEDTQLTLAEHIKRLESVLNPNNSASSVQSIESDTRVQQALPEAYGTPIHVVDLEGDDEEE